MSMMPPPPDPADRDRHGSAADYAHAALRDSILARRLRPGQRMREVELTEWLGISRTPVRQALARLEIEGLLTLQPRLGLVVATLDDEAMEELYEIRSVLEAAAAGMAVRHATPRDLDALRDLVAREAALPADPDLRFGHNLEFHAAIYRAAHNRFLVKSLGALNDAIALLGSTTMAVEGRVDAALDEHRALVEAIAARDKARAEALARDHIDTALNLRRRMARPG